MTDSTDPGFLVATTFPPPDDIDLDVVLQAWIVGLTGLPGGLVRPRWQLAQPASPDQTVNWCAVGVLSQDPSANEAMVHVDDGTNPGYSVMQRHEDLDTLVTFYGPHCSAYAGMVRDGSRIAQNRDTLAAVQIMLVDTGKITVLPDLVNGLWVRRADLPIMLRRQINRAYPIRTLIVGTTPATIILDNDPA